MDRTPAAEAAYRRVKERLLDGSLAGGTMLTEGEVAADVGVSRTPVREAFLRLASEGWLRLFPKRGALVVPEAPGEAEAVVEARVLLESHAVEALCAGDEAGRRAVVAHLRAAVREQAAALDEDATLDGYAALDAAFHQAVVAAGGNPVLTELAVALGERHRRMVARAARTVEPARALVRDHEELVGRIADGDAEGFRTALVGHLARAHLAGRALPAGLGATAAR